MSALWAIYTLIAAAAQTGRNAMQRELTASLGALGATHVRFLFGAPFAIAALLAARIAHGPIAMPGLAFWGWVLVGALTQIAATALMLLTMEKRSFVVSTAYLKTEPVLVALMGLVFLGDVLTAPMALAIMMATGGVILMSLPREGGASAFEPNVMKVGVIATGLGGAALFGLSSIGYRGALLTLTGMHYLTASGIILGVAMTLQALLLAGWLEWRTPGLHAAILRQWKPSLAAGFMGAIASLFWLLAFALATAASVRTLALVEVLFAQIISHRLFHQATRAREVAGIALLLAGAVLIVWAHP